MQQLYALSSTPIPLTDPFMLTLSQHVHRKHTAALRKLLDVALPVVCAHSKTVEQQQAGALVAGLEIANPVVVDREEVGRDEKTWVRGGWVTSALGKVK